MMPKIVFWNIILILFVNAHSLDSNKIIPLYENQFIIGDYRLNQAWQSFFRWSLLAPLIGYGTFSLVDGPCNSETICTGSIGILISLPAVPISGLVGYFKGEEMNFLKKAGQLSHSRFLIFGYEFSSNNLINHERPERSKLSFYPSRAFYTTFRFPKNNRYIDEIKFGQLKVPWFGLFGTSGYSSELDIQLISIFNRRIINPYLGIGFGNFLSKNIYLHGIGGIKINVYDYFFFRFGIDYELFGLFTKLTRYGRSRKVKLGLGIGTYIF